MTETKKQREEREAAEAAERAKQEKGQEQESGTTDRPATTTGEGHDQDSAGEASLRAPANQNATTFGRGEELAALERIVRGGVTPLPEYPSALPRENQEENAAAAAEEAAKNLTGTDDGIASVYPQVGGPTNLARTQAEVFAQLDDGAVDARGRLVGVYLDDIQAAQQEQRRALIEQAGRSPASAAAAARLRELASSPSTPASDIGKPLDEQGLVSPSRHTSHDGVDPNDSERRQREQVAAHDQAPGTSRR